MYISCQLLIWFQFFYVHSLDCKNNYCLWTTINFFHVTPKVLFIPKTPVGLRIKGLKNHCFEKLCLKLFFGNPKTLIVTKKEGMKDRS